MFQDWRDVSDKQVLRILKKLEELFTNEEAWIYWPLAQDKYGNEVKPTDPTAAKFSLMGASELYTTELYNKPLCDFIDCALRDYLNELSGDDLIHGRCDWKDEMLLIKMGIGELEK